MPFFAKRDTVMPAHLKEGGDFFSDTGTLHPSEGYSKKTKRSKRRKNTKNAVIWISLLLIALAGAAAASVCFFLHMGDIDKITSMINMGKIVLPTEDAHPTHNGGLGKRAGPYGYHSIVNASSVISSTTDVSSVASGTGTVFETETSTLDTLLTQSPFTTVTRTTSVSYPASTTDDADMSTVVVTSFVTEQPTVVETSSMGMATVTATVSQAPNVTTVTAPGSTVISTIVTQGSADAISGSPLIPTGSLGWNSTAGGSTPTVTVVTTVTPCPLANTTGSVFGVSSMTTSAHNNTISSLGTTITSGEVVSGTSSESSDSSTSSCTSTASTTTNKSATDSTSETSSTSGPLTTSPGGTPAVSDVTVDVTVTVVGPVASIPSLNSTTLIPNGTTTISIGMDMGTGIPLSTVVSTSIVRVNTTTSWTMPTMTMPVSDSAASQNKPEPKWWGGSNGGGATTCTMMLVAIVAFIVM